MRGPSKRATTVAVTRDTQVADPEELRAALEIERMALVGQSFAALVAIHSTAAHPARVAALLLLEPAPGSSGSIPQFSQRIQARLADTEKAELAALVQSEAFRLQEPKVSRGFMTVRFGACYFDRSAMSRHDLGCFTADSVRKVFVSSQGFSPYLAASDVHALLAGIACPTLIVRVDYDPIPLASAERLHQGIVRSHLVVFPSCGHFAHIEAEAAYFEVIGEFPAALH